VKVAAIHLGNTEHDGPIAEAAYWAMVADGMVYDEVQAEWDELRARGIGWGIFPTARSSRVGTSWRLRGLAPKAKRPTDTVNCVQCFTPTNGN
jgi:hypothetical protein